jgi:hypothetical protein
MTTEAREKIRADLDFLYFYFFIHAKLNFKTFKFT